MVDFASFSLVLEFVLVLANTRLMVATALVLGLESVFLWVDALFVGANGEIKNAPECNETVGLIQNMEQPQQLIDLVKTSVFQKYWYVTKERCEVCKDCEFRHACIDNRVPHQRENGYWYHLEECNYDPYTGSWKSEAKPPA